MLDAFLELFRGNQELNKESIELTRFGAYKKLRAMDKPNLAFAILHNTVEMDTVKEILDEVMVERSPMNTIGMNEEGEGQ